MSAETLVKGAGLGILLEVWYVRESLGPSHILPYFHRLPLDTVILAVLAGLLAMSLAASFVWKRIERLNRSSFWWPGIAVGIMMLEYHRATYIYTREWSSLVPIHWVALGSICLLTAYGLQRWRRHWFERFVEVVGVSLALWGCSTLIIIPELVYMARSTSRQDSANFKRMVEISDTEPRICWILFDELSHDQVYEHRAPDLQLPNFDRFRLESTIFSNVHPANDYTRIAIPAMFLGRPASRMRSSFGGFELSLYMDDTGKWEQFDSNQTIFARARRLGWATGVVGWANPYCRLMTASLDSCYWAPYDDPIIPRTNMDPSYSVAANVMSVPLQWFHALIPAAGNDGEEYRGNWIARRELNYHSLMNNARELIENRGIRFEFIHLPIPHFPSIYDRKAGKFAAKGSYLDNLALADLALGDLLKNLEQTPEWPKTTVIISGDHSWRPWASRSFGFWTAEDERASRGGNYDRRPVLAVHLPGQQAAHTVGRKFPAILMPRMLDMIMRGRLHSPDDLVLETVTHNSRPGIETASVK